MVCVCVTDSNICLRHQDQAVQFGTPATYHTPQYPTHTQPELIRRQGGAFNQSEHGPGQASKQPRKAENQSFPGKSVTTFPPVVANPTELQLPIPEGVFPSSRMPVSMNFPMMLPRALPPRVESNDEIAD